MTDRQKQILNEVCAYYAQTSEDILGKRRLSEMVIPRRMTMYLLFTIERLSKSHIARIFDTTHPNIINAIRKVSRDENLLYVAKLIEYKFMH